MELDIENINSLIRLWRKEKLKANKSGDKEEQLIASCYIDAFQTVRVNHGLVLLPKELPSMEDL